MKKFASDLINGLKGFAMGAIGVIPGGSGGTVALVTGIFPRLVNAFNAILEVPTWKLLFQGKVKEFWTRIDGRFLVAIVLGLLISMFSLAKLMEYLIHLYPVQTTAFFFGIIAASAAVMLLGIKDWKWGDCPWLLVGLAAGVLICTLSPTQTTDDLWFIAVCGAIVICSMILPGVSGSFILLILGKYDYLMKAISDLNWPVLIVFGVGCVLGILAFSKLLHWTLERYEKQTMLVLVGFVIGSLVKVWPWSDPEAIAVGNILSGAPQGSIHVNGAIFSAAAGVFLVWVLEIFSKSSKK